MNALQKFQVAYEQAVYLNRLRETKTMVLLDIDGTIATGAEEPSEQELSDRWAVRKLLNDTGVVAGAVTARTASLTLSSEAFAASETLRAREFPPKSGMDPMTGKRMRIPLEEKRFFDGCLNFDLTASFGSVIIVNCGQDYMVDEEFYQLLRHDYVNRDPDNVVEREPWRHVMQVFLSSEKLRPFMRFQSKLEDPDNYYDGVTDSAPLNFRYQYNFEGPEGLEMMRELKGVLDDLRFNGHRVALRINRVDESKPDLNDPSKSRYTLYLIPWNGSKEKMVNRLFSQSVRAAGIAVKDTKLLYAGDTLTDLRAGLWAGGDAKMTFLLATGSRLAPYITQKIKVFGDEDISFLWPPEIPETEEVQVTETASPEGEKLIIGEIADRLVPTEEKGVYQFKHKIRKDRVNTVVVGDERYPNTTAPGSVHKFLQEFL